MVSSLIQFSKGIFYCGADEFKMLTSSETNLKPMPLLLNSAFVDILCKANIEMIVYRESYETFSWYVRGFGIGIVPDFGNREKCELFSSDLLITKVTESPVGIIGLSQQHNCFYHAVFIFDESSKVFKWTIQQINVKQQSYDNAASSEINDINSCILDKSIDASHQSKFIYLASNNTEIFAIDETNSIYNVLENKLVWRMKSGKITKLACGFSHNLILTDSGAVYAWGNGSRGQLGQDVIVLSAQVPTRIEFFDDLPDVVSDIVTGGWNSLALTSEGDVYSWGWNESYQGHSSLRVSSVQSIPYPIDLGSQSNPVVAISSGGRHSAMLMKDGSVYSFGLNTFGQLGLNDQDNRSEPTQIDLTSMNEAHTRKPRTLICVRWGTFLIF